jgi:hypothetical protein
MTRQNDIAPANISDYLAKSSGLEQAAAFDATRALFVHFCRRGWCHPAAAHFLKEGDCS